MADQLRVALVGYGYWGPNLARNIHQHPETQLCAVVESNPKRGWAAKDTYPDIHRTHDYKAVLKGNRVDAVVIATPPETHRNLAELALQHDKHVLCEKPMTLLELDSDAVLVAAADKGKVLMVDHVYCYSAAAQKIKQIIDKGQLGDLLYVDSTRINLGLFQQHCDVVWDLAVHDFSLLDYFFPRLQPASLTAQGTKHYTEYHDTGHILLKYRNSKAQAHIHVNWLSPVKVRQMIIAGTEKSIVWNDMDPVEPVRVYDSGAVFDAHPEPGDIGRAWQMQYRRGDIWTPRISNSETLSSVIGEFAQAIQDKRKPLTDGCAGRRVVRLLARAALSLKGGGQRCVFSREPTT